LELSAEECAHELELKNVENTNEVQLLELNHPALAVVLTLFL